MTTKALNMELGDRFSAYHGDCCEVLKQIPEKSIDFCIHSPPFSSLYIYSDSENDMGNSADDAEFFQHYSFLVEQIARVTLPGRLTAVHCMDIPAGNGTLYDFPADIVRLHERHGKHTRSGETVLLEEDTI